LRAALERIAQARNGVVVLLREQESTADLIEALRGLGVPAGGAHHGAPDAGRGASAGLSAAALTATQGLSAAAASRPVLRTYGIGAQILKDLGVRRMRVLSAPKQMHGLSAFDLEVESYADEA
jgi:3,4-dihydroxy 2-butanone 4-phosphate synthase/GTP cyclohydrolase II